MVSPSPTGGTPQHALGLAGLSRRHSEACFHSGIQVAVMLLHPNQGKFKTFETSWQEPGPAAWAPAESPAGALLRPAPLDQWLGSRHARSAWAKGACLSPAREAPGASARGWGTGGGGRSAAAPDSVVYLQGAQWAAVLGVLPGTTRARPVPPCEGGGPSPSGTGPKLAQGAEGTAASSRPTRFSCGAP